MRPAATLLVALGCGCSVVTPPPVMPNHDLAQPKPEGTTSITLVGGYAFGVWVDDGTGALLRVGHQVDSRSELGVDLAIGRRRWSRAHETARVDQAYQECRGSEPDRSDFPLFSFPCTRRPVEAEPGRLTAVRGWLRWNPDPDRRSLALVFGGGYGWMDNGMRYLTADAALLASTHSGRLDGYVAPQLAVSLPIARGPAFYNDARPRTTIYVGGSGGAMVDGNDNLVTSLELSSLLGVSLAGESVFMFGTSAAGGWRSKGTD